MIVSVTHEGKTFFPNAATRLEPGDTILIMASRDGERKLRIFLAEKNQSQH